MIRDYKNIPHAQNVKREGYLIITEIHMNSALLLGSTHSPHG